MELASFIVSTIVALIGVTVTVRSRQLSRASLRLHFGTTGLEPDRPRKLRRLPKRIAIYGLPLLNRDHFVLPLAIGIENRSSLAISNARLQIEYPAECLLDETDVVDPTRGKFTLGAALAPGRKANRFATLAQVTYDFDLIRAGEKIVVHEVVRIPRNHVPGIDDSHYEAALHSHWEGADGFCSAFHVELSLFAANCAGAAMLAVLVAILADGEPELTRRAGDLMRRLWHGHPSARSILPWRRPSSELAELTLLSRDALVITTHAEVDPTILKNARTAVLSFVTPPWGVTGQAPT
jgi:hypothetical protein